MQIETAPMAGYTNAEFRRALVECGARVVWTEMVSATAISYAVRSKAYANGDFDKIKTLKLLKWERVAGVRCVVQLFGCRPEHFVDAIKSELLGNFDEININMGCPAGKIIKNGEGVALMNAPDLAREIIRACVAVSPVPVSVKIRLGAKRGDTVEKGLNKNDNMPKRCSPLKDDTVENPTETDNPATANFLSFVKMCESAGAARIIIHARYGSDGYAGRAEWDKIALAVRAAGVPIIANGDIKTRADVARCLDETGAAGVMVGRALLPIYRKYFPDKLQILRGEKICSNCGVSPCVACALDLFR
jgi:tRNA-dihydrouridine synthase